MNAKISTSQMKQAQANKVTQVETAIVGAGFGGMAMAIKLLKEKGLGSKNTDFIMLEKGSTYGGTWRDNTYPGCACDVQSHMYSFSFVGKHDWTKRYAPWREIQDYILATAKQFNLDAYTRFGAEVVAAHFDDATGKWTLSMADGSAVICRYFVLASGPLHVVNQPEFTGIDTFKGEVFHSAQWNHDYDLTGKKVVSIGTGGSAIQYVPEIAPKVDQLYVLQRSAAWVIPRDERKYFGIEKALFKRSDTWRKLHRARLYASNEARVLPIFKPEVMKYGQKLAEAFIKFQVKDKDTAKKLTPDYVMGCKRILISNKYYPTFNRNNVELVTDAIDHVTENAVVLTSGRKLEADCIIYGTGFITDPRIYMKNFAMTGLAGHDLHTDWADGAESYMGIATAGYPNFFQLVGPNTGLGHNSIIFMIEAQVDYILSLMKLVKKNRASYVTVKAAAQTKFNDKIQQKFNGTVWQTGCASWYNQADGKNVMIWPGYTWEYWLRTRRVKAKDYEFVTTTATA